MPSLLSCCAMACLAQCAAGANDELFLLHTRAQKVGHQTVIEAKVESQGQSAGAPPFDVFDMRDQPKNRDHEGDCKWRCANNDRCTRYVYNAISLYCKMFEESYSTPFDVFDMRDQKKNRDNQGDCKWRCDNNYQCERFEYDASTLFCKLFKKSEDDFIQGAPAFDVFDMRDHPKSRDHDGDCTWRCRNNHRCARYEYDASTLFCKMFEKSEDNSSQGAPPFDVFDMRDHPRNRNHNGDCKWRCGNNTRCARYEYDAITLICKMFEKPKDQFNQDGNDQVLVVDKSKSDFTRDSDQDVKEDDKKSEKGFKHDSDHDDKETSDNNVKDDKGNGKSKQRLKRKSKQNDKGDKKSENGSKHDSDQDDKETSDKKAKNDKGNKMSKQRLKRKSDQNDKDDKDHRDDKKSEKAFKQDSDQDIKDDKGVKGDKKSEKDFNHDSDQDDKETSDNNAQDGKGKRKSKQPLKRNSDQNDKTHKEQEAETNPDLVSDNHDEHSEADSDENKKPKEKQESKPSSWRTWFRR